MPCINVREGEGVVIVYDLDQCGAPDTGAGGKLVLSNISEVSWEDQIDDGDDVTERAFGGRKCYTDKGQPEISSVNLSLTSCGINPALDSFLMGSTLYTNAGDVVGFGRVDLSSTSNVAIEVLLKLDADACSGGGTAPVAGWFFPLVKNWKPDGGTTLNGSDLVKPKYTGGGYKNPNIFTGNPSDLSRWNAIFTEGTSATTDRAAQWYGFNIFYDITTLPTADCEPVNFAAAS